MTEKDTYPLPHIMAILETPASQGSVLVHTGSKKRLLANTIVPLSRSLNAFTVPESVATIPSNAVRLAFRARHLLAPAR